MTLKKGQAAAGAAVLVAIIAGLLVMFIVLIPPQERADLLGENDSTSDSDTDIDDQFVEKELLEENPGRIDFLAETRVEHPLPVINIYTQTESKVLAEKNVASVKKGVFTEQTSDFSFTVPDLSNTQNVLLSFSVSEQKGRVLIYLNEELIFDAQAKEGVLQPITLPKNLLQSQNSLVFAVSSPGVAFWQTNKLLLEKIKIFADVTSVEAQSSKSIFLVSETEKRNMERAVLRFQPDCDFFNVGKLEVLINGNEIYNAVPDCDVSFIPIEISADVIYQGENEVIFSTSQGTYILSHVSLESKLKEVEFPTYYFELSAEEFEDVIDDNLRVRANLAFVDVVTRKSGAVVINGHIENFDTKEVNEVFDLSDDVVRGVNSLKIKPKKTLEVRELRVDLVK